VHNNPLHYVDPNGHDRHLRDQQYFGPLTREQTFAAIPPEQRQSFENWGKPLKSVRGSVANEVFERASQAAHNAQGLLIMSAGAQVAALSGGLMYAWWSAPTLLAGTGLVGAGGSWPTIGERAGGAVAQATRVSCGAACGEKLTRVSQEVLIGKAGAPTSMDALAQALGAGWRGGYLDPADLPKLLALGRPFAAELRDGGRLGHLVVVVGMKAGELLIRDPWAGGSTYRMLVEDFVNHWSGGAVF